MSRFSRLFRSRMAYTEPTLCSALARTVFWNTQLSLKNRDGRIFIAVSNLRETRFFKNEFITAKTTPPVQYTHTLARVRERRKGRTNRKWATRPGVSWGVYNEQLVNCIRSVARPLENSSDAPVQRCSLFWTVWSRHALLTNARLVIKYQSLYKLNLWHCYGTAVRTVFRNGNLLACLCTFFSKKVNNVWLRTISISLINANFSCKKISNTKR